MHKMSVTETTYQPGLRGQTLSFPSLLPLLTGPETAHQPALSAQFVSPPQFLPRLDQRQDLSLTIEVPAFGVKLIGDISNLRFDQDYSTVVFDSPIDANVFAQLTLHNERSNGGRDDLRIKNVSLRLEIANHDARTHFVSDSLYAMLGLAGPIRISVRNLKMDLGLNFNIAMREISKFLQLRQLEFGLMVIGKACNIDFEIPPHISGEEVNSISFSYHAILMRQFEWRVNEIVQPTPATEEMLFWFDNLKPVSPDEGVYKLMFGPSSITKSVLGHEVALGQQTVFLDDAHIENHDQVRNRLARNDGEIVPIRIVPRSRKGKYVFTGTPSLPNQPWDDRIDALVALEQLLDERLTSRYHQLAKSTLSDLTTSEIESVLARPDLPEEFYSIRD
jgi:hypothetical protein